MTKPAELTGLRFGKWTVVSRSKNNASGKSMWFCNCDCGTTSVVGGGPLSSGRSLSCGCGVAAITSANKTKHGGGVGGQRTKEYRAWIGIRRRCTDERNALYKRYGAAGVTVSPLWLNDFTAFLNYIGPAPSEKHSIDRIDNGRGYEPGNVRWATQKQQCRNKTNNVYVEISGKRMVLAEACEERGMDYHLVWQRLRSGFSTERAFS